MAPCGLALDLCLDSWVAHLHARRADGSDPRTVAVAYDYNPGGQRQRDRDERRGCPSSHPRFNWPLAAAGGSGLDLRKRVIATSSSGDIVVACPTHRARANMSSSLRSYLGRGGSKAITPIRPSHRLRYPLPVPADPARTLENGDTARHPAPVGLSHCLRIFCLTSPRGITRLRRSTLRILRDPEQLWSSYGIRSLSKKDLFYAEPNAPGDAPYWRGAIWIPINFLALRACKFYADHPRVAQDLAELMAQTYSELRSNLMGLVLGEWERTGSLWEHYDDATGHGMRSHPFTGWTALILNIMSEKYSI